MDVGRAAIFVRVVQENGFSAAGRRLGVPKTTVSKRVSDLEAELGIRLLHRTTRKLSLTEAGARVYAHCVIALRHLDDAEREVQALQEQPEGALAIAAPSAVAVPFLLPALDAFMTRYPRVRITLRAMNEAPDLDRRDVDVLIWAGETMPAGHSIRLVAAAELGLFAHGDYVGRHGQPATPRDLAGHAIIASTQAMDGDRLRLKLERGEERAEIAIAAQIRFSSDDPMAVLGMIARGRGIGGLPLRLVAETADGRRLVPILADWRIPPIALSAVYLDAGSRKVRLLLDFIADWFRRL